MGERMYSNYDGKSVPTVAQQKATPDDIPQDVWEYATAACKVWTHDPAPFVIESHARAIMAEREACAMIADAILHRNGTMRFVQDAGWSGLRQVLSAAIRNR